MSHTEPERGNRQPDTGRPDPSPAAFRQEIKRLQRANEELLIANRELKQKLDAEEKRAGDAIDLIKQKTVERVRLLNRLAAEREMTEAERDACHRAEAALEAERERADLAEKRAAFAEAVIEKATAAIKRMAEDA